MLENFKGATTPLPFAFDPAKKIVIIFGENGTGKSTIVDAIDFVCNQSFGSLDQKSVGGKKHELIVSLNKPVNDLKVVLQCGTDTWQSGIVKSKPSTSGSGQKLSVQILRRSDILKFIDGEPKQRYEKLQPFIALPRCEKNESALRNGIKNDDASFAEAVRAIDQAKSTLDEIWKATGSPGANSILWARQQASQDITALKKLNNDLRLLLDGIRKSNDKIQAVAEIERGIDESNKSLSKLETDKASLQTKTNLDSLVKVLQNAKQYFTATDLPAICPVCEQTIDIPKLRDEIESKLANLKALSDVLAKINSCETILAGQQSNLAKEQKNSVDDINAVVKNWNALVPEERKALGCFNLVAATDYAEAIKVYHVLEPTVPVIEKRQAALKGIELIDSVKIHLKVVDEKTNNAGIIQSRLSTLRELLKIVEETRKGYIDSVLKNIASDIEKLYISLHPAEGLGGIQFMIDPNKIGSLDLNGCFQGANAVLPQAYYSESHLDTLGICIFLALAKYFKTEVVVLDDVVTSADEVHMTRYIDMLHNEANSFDQVILTTHYRPLRDRYRFNRAPASQVQLFELKPWSLNSGVQPGKSTLWIDDVCHYNQPQYFDRQIVASKAGILLEALLDDLTLRYRCSLPRQAEPFYTLGDLLNGLSKKLKLALKVEVLDDAGKIVSSTQLFDKIERINSCNWIRNQVGCHFNVTGLALADKDVADFGNNVVDLTRNLVCPSCGSVPRNDKSGSYWECQCKKVRLHPLENPG